jgi:hypothetical protein
MSLVSMQGCPTPPPPTLPGDRRGRCSKGTQLTTRPSRRSRLLRRRARPATDFGQVPGAAQAVLRWDLERWHGRGAALTLPDHAARPDRITSGSGDLLDPTRAWSARGE